MRQPRQYFSAFEYPFKLLKVHPNLKYTSMVAIEVFIRYYNHIVAIFSILVSGQPCNVVRNMIYFLYNQFRRIDIKKYIVALTEDERDALGVLASNGEHKSQKSSMH